MPYSIGSQSAPYGAPGLRERNFGAPRSIRLLIKILTWMILQLSKEAITALIKFIVGLRKLWSISSWAPQHQKFENPCLTVLLLQVVPKRIMMSQKRWLQINSWNCVSRYLCCGSLQLGFYDMQLIHRARLATPDLHEGQRFTEAPTTSKKSALQQDGHCD